MAFKRPSSARPSRATSTSAVTPEVALLVQRPWIDHILNGDKIWEMRSTNCLRRGRIALACSGTGLLLGEVDVVDAKLVACKDEGGALVAAGGHEDFLMLPQNLPKHRLAVDDVRALDYPRWWAWVLSNPKWYREPVPYVHPLGAVNWVKLADTNVEKAPKKRPRRN